MGRRDKGAEREVAGRRIRRLHDLAFQAACRGDEPRASRYATLARRIGMRYQEAVPAGLGRRLCRRCGAYLLPGRTARVRLSPGKVSWTCLSCGEAARVPHTRERRLRRAHGLG